MMFPLFFTCPPAYIALRSAAVMRHAATGMPPHLHFALMRLVYGL